MKAGNKKTLQLFTIGHSSRSFEEFLSLLKEFEICVVADIRRYPSSRRFPHFNGEELRGLLSRENIPLKVHYHPVCCLFTRLSIRMGLRV